MGHASARSGAELIRQHAETKPDALRPFQRPTRMPARALPLLAAALHSASAAQLTQPHIWVIVADGTRLTLPPCPRCPAALPPLSA